MTDVDAIARLLDVGFNAVFLWMLWRVYQDFISSISAHTAYLEKLVERLMPEEEKVPPAVRAHAPPTGAWASRTPTELGV